MQTITQAPSFKRGYKFPIYPTQQQKELFEKTFGCCRYVYNKGIENAKLDYEHWKKAKDEGRTAQYPALSGYDFINRMSRYKSDPVNSWLYDVSACALQQAAMHLGDAFKKFFRDGKGYPQFKKKHDPQSFTLMRTFFRFKGSELFIAKSKRSLKVGFSRPLPSVPSQVSVSKTPAGKYYISFVCDRQPEKTSGQGKIGIDLGIKDFLVTSDGVRISNPKHFHKYQKQLKRRQQSLARKQKGSKNRNKARLIVAKQHERIANARRDFHHKLSRSLINDNQVIGIEKLMVRNMIKNHKLAKSISDVGWSSFTTILKYKALESQHCSVDEMDAFYPSSHICNADQVRLDRKLSLKEREWTCPSCGVLHDRDINAACNIRDEAITTLVLYKIPDGAGMIVRSTQHH